MSLGVIVPLTLLLSAGCSDDTPAPPPHLKDSEVYSGKTLVLTYNGEEMPGKSVGLKLSDGGNCDMKLFSEFDLSQLAGMGLSGKVPGPGVIPGSVSSTLSASFSPGDGCYTFSGEGASDFATFGYSGRLTDKILYLDIKDCRLRNQALAGEVLAPAPIVKGDGLIDYKSMPFHLLWEIDPAAGVDIPLTEIFRGIVMAPVIPVYDNTAYTSVAQMIVSGIKTVALTPGGNIPVMYVSTTGGAAHIATTCGNMLQYVSVVGGIKLYVNPLSALSRVLVALSKPSDNAHFSTKADADAGAGLNPEVMKALVQAFAATAAPLLSEGIPMAVAPSAEGVDIYFDTRESVTFLASLLGNLVKNPEVMKALEEYLVGQNPPMLKPDQIAGIIQKLPILLEHTTRLELGLSFVRAGS